MSGSKRRNRAASAQGVRLTIGNLQDLIAKGELRNAGSDFTRFADGLMPGRSLWYTRLA